MAGTMDGGQAAAETNRKKYGPDFYARIGAIGGKRGHTGGFAAGAEGRQRARVYGALGGRLSKRGSNKEPETPEAQALRTAVAAARAAEAEAKELQRQARAKARLERLKLQRLAIEQRIYRLQHGGDQTQGRG